jgi:hypothetical protein
MATRKANALAPSNDEYGVRWAAPVRPTTRSNELGELESSILKEPEDLPFPKFYLQKEYNTAKDYENDKKQVEFNRALLSHGFRRLAALEVKDEYEVGMRRMTLVTHWNHQSCYRLFVPPWKIQE